MIAFAHTMWHCKCANGTKNVSLPNIALSRDQELLSQARAHTRRHHKTLLDIQMNNEFIVVGIGEMLWDVFPEGKKLGGAPVNFAFHCGQLGGTGYLVSDVGNDSLGNETQAILTDLNISSSFVATDTVHPTGTVQVTLCDGKPSYEICEHVAWDNIPCSEKLIDLARRADAACFGSLAQRDAVSRAAIHAFVDAMPTGALKIFDINLRQAFFSKVVIEQSLRLCNILKLSDEELPVVAAMFGLAGTESEQLKQLRALFELRLVAYTRGPDGSLLVTEDEIDEHPGCPGKAVDSVGAGDSFTATLCVGLLDGKPLSEVNDHANRVATFVCQQAGATPVFPDNLK